MNCQNCEARGYGMKIRQITRDKDDYIDMLLMADPQKDMIERYLYQSEMFVLVNGGDVCSVCVVQLLKNRKCELKNIATRVQDRGKGYAAYLIHYICEYYSDVCDTMYAGTGNGKKMIEFLERSGFVNSHIDVKKVVDLALEAGRILLKNGAEIFRVDETITRICRRFHVEYVDTFILSHAIFVSAENGMEEAYTKVKQVPLSSTHLGIVAEVNALSREISAGNVGVEEALRRLGKIDNMPPVRGYLQVLAAGIGSGFFGYMMGAAVTESVIAFFIGCILYLWVLKAKKHNISKIIVNIIGGVIITVLAILALHLPFLGNIKMDGMIIGSIMPLVPGLAFVNAIRDIADSDFLSGTVRMIDALLVFVCISVGVGATLSLYNSLIGGMVL